MGPPQLALPSPRRESGLGHSFAEAALLGEGAFEAAEVLVQEVVGLVDEADEADEADEDVGHDLRRATFDELPIGVLVGCIRFRAELPRVHGNASFLVTKEEYSTALYRRQAPQHPRVSYTGIRDLP